MAQTPISALSYAPLESKDLTFVVGTGRCGSTMISDMFRKHPDVLSLSEFFTLLVGSRFQEGILDASQFWALCSAPNPLSFILRLNIAIPEILSPLNATSPYYTEGVPGILLVPLPHLTEDYEALYEELQLVVNTFPPARVEQHYARLFGWLKQRFGCKICVERSGYSLSMLPDLIRLFPQAKFVHIVRDGRECAISMSRHYLFRLRAALALGREKETISEILSPSSPNWRLPFPEQFYLDVARDTYEIPLDFFGHIWSDAIIEGVHQLSQLPEERTLTIAYEELIENSQQNLERLMAFIDPSLLQDIWVHTAVALIKPKRPTWKTLSPQKIASLEAACQPGLVLLETIIQKGLYS